MIAMGEMETGFNSDVVTHGVTYHVQTEDWGASNPFIVTRVFHSGAVLLSVKTAYEEVQKKSFARGQQAIRLGMREQHQKVLDQLVSGALFQSGLR